MSVRRSVLVGALVAVVLGAGGVGVAVTSSGEPVTVGPVTVGPALVAPRVPVRSVGSPDTRAVPVAVRIPRLGVDSALVPLTVGPAGELTPPETADVAGWFAAGTVPGEIGPAVLAGHVDSASGPGVFYDLADLRPATRSRWSAPTVSSRSG